MKNFLKKLFKCNLEWHRNILGDIVVKCPDCGEESILQNVYLSFGTYPERYMPFCPHCNMVVYHDSCKFIKKMVNTKLHGRMKDIIVKRYGLGETPRRKLEELSQEYGLTREWIRQIELAGLEILRMKMKRAL